MTAKKAAENKNETGGAHDFEKALTRLETIVTDMEGGKLSLDDMIKKFEEGQSLIKFCSARLNEVERKIEILIKKDGKLATEPFEDVSDDN